LSKLACSAVAELAFWTGGSSGSDSRYLQRHGSALGDALHDKSRREALYARQGCKLFVIEPLKSCEIACDDPQEVVGIAKRPLGLKNIRDLGDRLFEHLEGGAV
jgi:hypothetical protein